MTRLMLSLGAVLLFTFGTRFERWGESKVTLSQVAHLDTVYLHYELYELEKTGDTLYVGMVESRPHKIVYLVKLPESMPVGSVYEILVTNEGLVVKYRSLSLEGSHFERKPPRRLQTARGFCSMPLQAIDLLVLADLLQCLGFNLSNTFAGHAEYLSYLL